MKGLQFIFPRIEKTSRGFVTIFGAGCRPSTSAEVDFWNRIESLERANAELRKALSGSLELNRDYFEDLREKLSAAAISGLKSKIEPWEKALAESKGDSK